MEIVTVLKKLDKGEKKFRGRVVYTHPEGIYKVIDTGKYRETVYPEQIINMEVK